MQVGSGAYSAFLGVAKGKGLTAKDFQLLNIGDVDAIAALEQGSVDAVQYWEPIVSIIETKGIGRELMSYEGLVNNPVLILARRQWVEQNRAAALAFAAGWSDALEFMTKQPNEAATIIVDALAEKGQKMDVAVQARALTHDHYETDLKPTFIADLKQSWADGVAQGSFKGTEPDWSAVYRPEIVRKPRNCGSRFLARVSRTFPSWRAVRGTPGAGCGPSADALPLVVFLVAWEAVSRLRLLNPVLLPPPSVVAVQMVTLLGAGPSATTSFLLEKNVFASSYRIFFGYAGRPSCALPLASSWGCIGAHTTSSTRSSRRSCRSPASRSCRW